MVGFKHTLTRNEIKMGLDIRPSAAYGIAVTKENKEAYLRELIEILETHFALEIKDTDEFLDWPDDQWEVVQKAFPQLEVESIEEGSLVIYIKNSHVGTSDKYESMDATLLKKPKKSDRNTLREFADLFTTGYTLGWHFWVEVS